MFLPVRPNVQVVFYNSTACQEQGLEPPRTWEAFLETARRFHEAEGRGRVLLKGQEAYLA